MAVAPCQSVVNVRFTDTACQVTAPPLIATNGQQIIIQCDTVYLVNKHRYRLYEKARDFILRTDISKEQELIGAYENQVQKAEEAYRMMLGKYEDLAAAYAEDLKKSAAGLEEVRKELILAQENVNKAAAELEDLRKNYRDRRSGLTGKLLWAGGGAAAGILLMILLN